MDTEAHSPPSEPISPSIGDLLDQLPWGPRALEAAHVAASMFPVAGPARDAEIAVTLMRPTSAFAARDGDEFAPYGRGAGSSWEKLGPEQWNHLVGRAAVSTSAALRAHYNDVLWTTKKIHRLASPKPIQYAGAAIDAYLGWAQANLSKRVCGWDLADALRRLANLGLRTGRPELAPVAFALASDGVTAFEAEARDKPGVFMGLARLAADIAEAPRAKVAAEAIEALCATLERILASYPDHGEASLVTKECVETLARLEAALGRPVDKARQRQVAAIHLSRGESRLKAGHGLVAEFELMDALKIYMAIGDHDGMAKAKESLRQAAELAVSQMKEVVGEFPMDPRLPMLVLAKLFAPTNWHDRLVGCAKAPELFPSYEFVCQQAERSAEQSLFSRLASTVVYRQDRQIAHDPDGVMTAKVNLWHLVIDMGLKTAWIPFLAIAAEEGLTVDDLLSTLDQHSLIPPGHAKSIRRGLERFFEGDFISAIHILAPQIESALRALFAAHGIDSTAFRADKGGHLLEKPLSVFFDEKIPESSTKVLTVSTIRRNPERASIGPRLLS